LSRSSPKPSSANSSSSKRTSPRPSRLPKAPLRSHRAILQGPRTVVDRVDLGQDRSREGRCPIDC
jgi:hypothetical protein